MDPGNQVGEAFGARAQLRINRSPDKAVYSINDNDGDDYALREGGVRTPGFRRPRDRRAASLLLATNEIEIASQDLPLTGEVHQVALAHKRYADVLRLSARPGEVHGEGFDLSWVNNDDTLRMSRTAAWVSFSHLLRQAAAQLLEISSGEFQSHISTYGLDLACNEGTRALSAEAFIADALDNGAGYASYFESAPGETT